MSADRRTMVIAAGAMLALIAIGVVSAALFTRSACGDLEPDPVAAGASGQDVEAVVAEALGGLEAEELAGILDGLGVLAGPDGRLVGAADVGPVGSMSAVADGVAALGDRVTVLGTQAAPLAAADLSDAVVVGDGPTLYALALVNPLTDQVDAFTPLDDRLRAGECVDTARVGVPLSFHLDAGGGQLLLLRVDDDAEDPEVELREADGVAWSAGVELGAGPPGQLAERLSGGLGEDLVVLARRSAPDDDAPGLMALGRPDGEVRWSLAPTELDPLAPGGGEALEPEVVAVTGEVVAVSLSREDRAPALLVGLDPTDGSPVWTSDLAARGAPVYAGRFGDRLLLTAPQFAAGEDEPRVHELVTVDPGDGSVTTLRAAGGTAASAATDGRQSLFAVDGELARVTEDEDEERSMRAAATVADLHVTGRRVALLLRAEEGGVVVWIAL